MLWAIQSLFLKYNCISEGENRCVMKLKMSALAGKWLTTSQFFGNVCMIISTSIYFPSTEIILFFFMAENFTYLTFATSSLFTVILAHTTLYMSYREHAFTFWGTSYWVPYWLDCISDFNTWISLKSYCVLTYQKLGFKLILKPI